MPEIRKNRPALTRRAAVLGAAGLAATACASAPEPPLTGPPRGRVVLLRGLANVFSTGMDDLERTLRGLNYDADVQNHLDWSREAEVAIAAARAGRLPRPFAVIGHSLGADDGIRLAARFGQVMGMMDLLVTFDPVLVRSVPRGPRVVRNYYQRSDLWGGHTLSAERNFTGVLENRPVPGDNHLTIDKDPALHREVIALLAAARLAA
jgi:pimeloyl-ACP methyl ester carboxylesterase